MGMVEFLELLTSLQLLVAALILILFKSCKRSVNIYLGLFFFTLFIQTACYYLAGITNAIVFYNFPLNLHMLDGVFLLYFCYKTTGLSVKKLKLLFTFSIIEFIILVVAFSNYFIQNKSIDSYIFNILEYFLPIISTIVNLFFTLMTIKTIRKHKKLLPYFFKHTRYKSMVWLEVSGYFMILFLLYSEFVARFYPYELLFNNIENVTYLIWIYYVSIASLIQINIYNLIPNRNSLEYDIGLNNEKEHLENFNRIEKYIVSSKVFLDPEITLQKLSKEIYLSERSISEAINNVKNQNFKTYINNYRIEEFKRLVVLEKYKDYSIYAVAEESGFNSRSSFYKNFRELTGISPSDFIKDL